MAEDKKVGIHVDEFWERESGGAHTQALSLNELESAVQGAHEAFGYDESDAARELVALLGPVSKLLADISIVQATGELTFERECPTCSGAGSYRVFDPHPAFSAPAESKMIGCSECKGSGVINPRKERDKKTIREMRLGDIDG